MIKGYIIFISIHSKTKAIAVYVTLEYLFATILLNILGDYVNEMISKC